MARFDAMMPELRSGLSVQRGEWEPMTQMYVQGHRFVCQRGNAEPYPYDLAWYEIDASDWQVADNGFPRS